MREWYYLDNETKTGPVPEGLLRAKLARGELDQKTWVWTEGMPGWQPVALVEGLSDGNVPEYTPPSPDGRLPDPAARDAETWFLHISVARLLVMTYLSYGLYQVYWCYRNWRYLQLRDGERISPFWRAYFGIFWMHDLLGRIRRDWKLATTCPPTFPNSALASTWVVLPFLALPSRLLGETASGVIVLAFATIMPLCLVPVQVAINRANRAREPRPRMSPWTWGQWACLGYGVVVFGLMMAEAVLKVMAERGGGR